MRNKFLVAAMLGAVTFCVAAAQEARADSINLGSASSYALLYEGNGGQSLQMNNSTLSGNVGVGATGTVQISGGLTLSDSGNIDFSASNTGQFSASGPSTWGTVSYNVSAVSSALTRVNALSQALHGAYGVGGADGAGNGADIAINSATQTVNASAGRLLSITYDGVTQNIRVFDVTSFSNGSNGNGVLTINGSATDLIAFNLEGLGNFEFKNNMILTGGLTADNIVWNFGGGNFSTLSGGSKLTINNTAGSGDVVRGIFLDPNGAISVSDSNVSGRVFGGDSVNFAYVSGANITMPVTITTFSSVPLPGAAWAGMGLLAVLGAVRTMRRRRQSLDLE